MAESVVNAEQSMQDVPLAPPNADKNVPKWNELTSNVKSKSNSLKRFFKLPQRRHIDNNNSGEADGNEIEMNETDEKAKSADEGSPSPKHKGNKRFTLRMSSLQRKAGLTDLSRVVNEDMPSAIPSSSTSESILKKQLASASKSTLKTSLSTYWGSVFKKTKKDNKAASDEKESKNNNDDQLKESMNNLGNDFDEDVEKIVESPLTEEVHSLKISDDNESN